jgi:hypothetical protein
MRLKLAANRADPEVLDCLKDMGFNLLSLSNNHAWDLGEAGLRIRADEMPGPARMPRPPWLPGLSRRRRAGLH